MKYRIVTINHYVVLIQELLTEKTITRNVNDFIGTLMNGATVEEVEGKYIVRGRKL